MHADATRSRARRPQVTVQVDAETYAALRAIAELNHRTIAGEVRRLIEQHVESETSPGGDHPWPIGPVRNAADQQALMFGTRHGGEGP